MSTKRFRRFAVLTVGAVYFLILVGGIVRASGAGMGCPDWPKCFGQWVPPTAESQLPPNYQELYAEHGYGEDRFNVVKTWTEYVNRLIGVVIGLLIFAALLFSLSYWKSDSIIVWVSLAAFLLVGFQGWLGSVVVDSNLEPWIVTVHMLLALVIVGLLVFAVARTERARLSTPIERDNRLTWLLVAWLGLMIVQVGMGTQIREAVDVLAAAGEEREGWISMLGPLVYVHRSFSLLLLILSWWLARKTSRALGPTIDGTLAHRLYQSVMMVLVGEIVAGAVMYYFAIPAFLQPVHLLLAALLVGLQLGLLVIYLQSSAPQKEPRGLPLTTA